MEFKITSFYTLKDSDLLEWINEDLTNNFETIQDIPEQLILQYINEDFILQCVLEEDDCEISQIEIVK